MRQILIPGTGWRRVSTKRKDQVPHGHTGQYTVMEVTRTLYQDVNKITIAIEREICRIETRKWICVANPD